MDPDRMRELFDHASALPEGDRRSFLDDACAGDESARRELLSMLALDPEADGFMGRPLLAPDGDPAGARPGAPAASSVGDSAGARTKTDPGARKGRRKLPERVVPWLGVAGLLLLQLATPIGLLDMRALDLYQAAAPRAETSPILIVGIDQESMDALGEPFPWDRRLFARAIELLLRGGARRIGIDVVFDIPRDARQDGELARSVDERVVLATRLFDPSTGSLLFDRPAAVAPRASLGFADVYADPDGVVRHFLPAHEEGGRLLPSFAAAVAQGPPAPPTALLPVASQRRWSESYALVPFHGLLGMEGAAVRELVKDRTVLVGAIDVSLNDQLTTSAATLGGDARIPGVVWHAQCVDTMLAGYPVRELSLAARAVLLGAAALAGIAIGRRRRAGRLLGLATAGLLAATFVSYAAAGLFVPPILSCGALLVPGSIAAAMSRTHRSPAPLAAARPFGRYEIVEKLGEGAMGTILRARDPKLHRELAIKTLRLDPGPGFAEARARLLREAVIVARFNHPNIVSVYDVGDEAGTAFIAMELVDGMSLQHLLAASPVLSIPEGLALATALHAGLATAHARGIIHCDLKPANVLLGCDGSIKISDFGIAQALSDLARSREEVFGTPGYMAPEILCGQPAGRAVDYFSLGVILYQALAGKPPYSGRSTAELMAQTLFGEPPPLWGLDPTSLPEDVGRMVASLFLRDPEDRQARGDALGTVLQALVLRYGSRWDRHRIAPRPDAMAEGLPSVRVARTSVPAATTRG